MAEKKIKFLFPEWEAPAKKSRKKRRTRRSPALAVIQKLKETRDGKLRLKIIQGVANARVPWTQEVLLQALADPSEKIRDFLIKELASKENLDLKRVYHRMHHPPWYVKTGCLRILGLRKKASSVKHIQLLVSDPNIEVRRTAAAVLGEIGGKEAVTLLNILSRDKSPFVRASAERSLKKTSQLKFS